MYLISLVLFIYLIIAAMPPLVAHGKCRVEFDYLTIFILDLKIKIKSIYSVTDYAPSYEAVHTIVHQATA